MWMELIYCPKCKKRTIHLVRISGDMITRKCEECKANSVRAKKKVEE